MKIYSLFDNLMKIEPLKQNLLQKQNITSFYLIKKKSKLNNKLCNIQMEDPKNKYLLQLEGQCKITSLKFIRFHQLKAIFLLIPLIISVVGLLLLKYSLKFRIMILYVEQQNSTNATHVYIVGNQGEYQQIQQLQKHQQQTFFVFKKLKYILFQHRAYPLAMKYWELYNNYINDNHIKNGLDYSRVKQLTQLYGQNSHLVDIPTYLWYMFDIMTKPFFLIQYIICIMNILQKIIIFAVLLFGGTILTTTINYILLYVSYRKIKQIAQHTFLLRVIRSGKQMTIKSNQLVPGDVYFIQKNQSIPCDSILIEGQAYVNQSSLTGESVPVGKFRIQQQSQIHQNNRWLYEGSTILDCRNQTKALAINTGYRSQRGRIIRKISNKVPVEPQMFRTAIYFLCQTLSVGIIIYLAHLPILLAANVTPQFRVYRFFDFIGFSFPPTFPIYFNLSYSFALYRLRKKNIYGTQPEKTIDGAFLKTLCFDKTGTLTENKLDIESVYILRDQKVQTVEANQLSEKSKNDPMIQKVLQIFSSCHSVKCIDGELLGDEVDLKMFQVTKSIIQQSENTDVKFTITSSNSKLQIVKINEFQSKNQHMSVMVYNCHTKKQYLFVKGAPQKIHQCSIKKYSYFDSLLKKVSLNGLRSIGIAYKQLNSSEIQDYMKNEIPKTLLDPQRKKDFTMIGLVTFENKLKSDSCQIIKKLTESKIQTNIITGDNIYIAIQTAHRSGILQKKQKDNKIILIQGKNQLNLNPQNSIGNRKFKAKLLHFQSSLHHHQNQLVLQKQEQILIEENDSYLNQTYPIAVDNDFLKLSPQPELPNTIKIFARITPQNKALIVRKLKTRINEKYDQKSLTQKLISNRPKIGMVGDGANDLMALKQADVGLGISQTDASYGSCFSISNLLNIQDVIKQSKNTSTIIIQCIRYYGTISFLKITCSVLMMIESTYFSSNQLSYFNFTSTLIIPIAITLGSSTGQSTPLKPIVSFLSLKNHLIYWGNIIIPSLSIISGYFYMKSRDDFIYNPVPRLTPQGFYTLCQTTTVVWLLVQIPFALNGFFVYNNGYRFKQYFYHNWLLLLIVIGNVIADISYFFKTQSLQKSIGLVQISKNAGDVLLGITIGFSIMSYLFNWWVQRLEFEQKQFLAEYANQNIEIKSIGNKIQNNKLNETGTF